MDNGALNTNFGHRSYRQGLHHRPSERDDLVALGRELLADFSALLNLTGAREQRGPIAFSSSGWGYHEPSKYIPR